MRWPRSGVGLIFSIMRLINFAHGELIMGGGFTLYVLTGEPYVVMAVAAILIVTVLALAMERVAFRPLRGANPATLLIASFALSYLLQHSVLLIFGSRAMGFDFLGGLNQSIEIGSLRVPGLEIAVVVVTALLLLAPHACSSSARPSASRCAPRRRISTWRGWSASAPTG